MDLQTHKKFVERGMGHVGATEQSTTQLRHQSRTHFGNISQQPNSTNLCDRSGTARSQGFHVNEKPSGH